MAEFNEAVGVLLLGQPFFGTLLMKMEHVPVTDGTMPTLAVNKRQLLYNPAFLAGLTLDEAVFCVAHEVMHQAWQHLPRLMYYQKSGVGPDGKVLDARLFNQAMDYPINHGLVVAKVGTPMPKEKFPLCLNPTRFPHTMTPEEVYCILKEEQDDGGGKGSPDAMDGHDAMSHDDATDGITPADIIQAANHHKAIRGELPAGIDRLIGEVKRPEVSPWRRLRSFVTKSMPGHDASSWRRLQRRQIVRGIGMPGRVAQGAGVVGIVVDTSGSIHDEVLQLFGGHMAAIMADAMPESVRLYWVDAKLHRTDVVKTPSQLRQLLQKNVPGGGGTDMVVGVRAAEADKCDAIVVLTDGYTPFCDSHKPLLWAINTQVEASGNGKTVHI